MGDGLARVGWTQARRGRRPEMGDDVREPEEAEDPKAEPSRPREPRQVADRERLEPVQERGTRRRAVTSPDSGTRIGAWGL